MAGFAPMTPTTYLDRAADAAADRVGVVVGQSRFSYGEMHERCSRAAGGIGGMTGGRPVAVLSSNSNVLLEMHFSAPWASSPLVALNTRLAVPELNYIVGHSGAAVLLYEAQFQQVAYAIAASSPKLRLIQAGGEPDEYQGLIDSSLPRHDAPSDDGAVIAINYTSGTTGSPKGALYHHRGAYLQGMAQAGHAGLDATSVFLWTLPMFHCNGWGYPWAVTAATARHVCLPRVDPGQIWSLIHDEGVTHLNCAPTVLTMIGYAEQAAPLPAGMPLRICTGGAPPTPTLLQRMDELHIDITHLYGMTETYGPSVVCEWQPAWDHLPVADRARLRARQGVPTLTITGLEVRDKANAPVPPDGSTVGELLLRGHTLMLGYKDDDDATRAAIREGWLHTGDLAIRHPDGYIELKDRSKDVIISGGENIASIEVEQAIASHPTVLEVAVIGVPDKKWGEVPIAYIVPRPGHNPAEQEIIEHVRARLARFKAPKHVITVDALPKTATGKIQKFKLRDLPHRTE